MSESSQNTLVPEVVTDPTTDLVVGSLERLAADAEQLASESLSATTRYCYASDWRKWQKWCDSFNMDEYGPAAQLALWITHLVQTGSKVSTINRAVSAVAKAYQAKRLPSPRRDAAVQLVYSGARRRVGVSPEQVEALLPSALVRVCQHLPEDSVSRLRSVRNRAAICMGWSGGFRRSELLALDWEDVQEVPEGLKLRIRRSKTDQEGRGRLVGLPYASVLVTCPVRSLRAWREACGSPTTGPVFRSVSPNGQEVLLTRFSARQFADSIKTACKDAGLEGRFAGHSLRAGLVTAASAANKPLSSIMAQTGHKTVEMIVRYMREQGLFDNNAAAGLL